MTYRGQINNGMVTLDNPTPSREGAQLHVEVLEQHARITSPIKRMPLRKITSIELPGGLLSDDIIRDRQ